MITCMCLHCLASSAVCVGIPIVLRCVSIVSSAFLQFLRPCRVLSLFRGSIYSPIVRNVCKKTNESNPKCAQR